MGKFAISFTLKSDDTWSERYISLMGQIRACKKVWEETTSFALVETDENLDGLEHRLYYKSSISSSKDILLVIDVSYKSCSIRGATNNRAKLKEIMPGILEK